MALPAGLCTSKASKEATTVESTLVFLLQTAWRILGQWEKPPSTCVTHLNFLPGDSNYLGLASHFPALMCLLLLEAVATTWCGYYTYVGIAARVKKRSKKTEHPFFWFKATIHKDCEN